MSTRCQVQVVQHEDYAMEVTLYHHHDGYPEYMIHAIYAAYCWKDRSDIKGDWVKGRAGKVASLLCWVGPAEFEPEPGQQLHRDIDYYYRIHCSYSYPANKAKWEIDIYHRTKWPEHPYHQVTLADFELVASRRDIEELIDEY